MQDCAEYAERISQKKVGRPANSALKNRKSETSGDTWQDWRIKMAVIKPPSADIVLHISLIPERLKIDMIKCIINRPEGAKE